MMFHVLIAVACFSALMAPVQADSHICGTTIQKEMSMVIPRTKCNLRLDVKEGHTVKILVRPSTRTGRFRCPEHNSTVQISSKDTGDTFAICHEEEERVGYFSGSGGPFLLHMKNAPPHTVLEISFERHAYGCNKKVTNALIGQTIEFTKNNDSKTSCSLQLPTDTRIQMLPSTTCIPYELGQGQNQLFLTLSTKEKCKSSRVHAGLHDLYCAVGVLHHLGRKGEVLRFQLQAISAEDARDFLRWRDEDDCL